jgi:hypothetical protein
LSEIGRSAFSFSHFHFTPDFTPDTIIRQAAVIFIISPPLLPPGVFPPYFFDLFSEMNCFLFISVSFRHYFLPPAEIAAAIFSEKHAFFRDTVFIS